MKRRLSNKIVPIPSDELESQGPGTWIVVRKRLTLGNLAPVIRMAQFQDDPRLKGNDVEAVTQAIDDMMRGMSDALRPLVLAWNWVTDMEAELAFPPRGDGDKVVLPLASPIAEDASIDLSWLPIYLGKFPDDYIELSFMEADANGKVIVARGTLPRAYVPGEDYVVIGLPVPSEQKAWTWLGIEEMMWIVNAISIRFQSNMSSMAGRPKVAD